MTRSGRLGRARADGKPAGRPPGTRDRRPPRRSGRWRPRYGGARRERQRVAREGDGLMGPGQSSSPQAAGWGGLSWSPWTDLDQAVRDHLIPVTADLYRFRARDDPGLLYIGEGVNCRRRLRTLARALRSTRRASISTGVRPASPSARIAAIMPPRPCAAARTPSASSRCPGLGGAPRPGAAPRQGGGPHQPTPPRRGRRPAGPARRPGRGSLPGVTARPSRRRRLIATVYEEHTARHWTLAVWELDDGPW